MTNIGFHRRRGPDCVVREQGAAAIGLLLVVVILGVLATVVLSGGPNSAPSGATSTVAGQTTTTALRNVAGGAALAAIAACRADYELVASAINNFRALNGAGPASGTSWATSTAGGGPFLQSWPTSPRHFSLTRNGSTLSVVPRHGVASHGSLGTVQPRTGCFAA